MSNIYIQEPPTNGKVLLETTVGDIDIELWCKETPKACRNFVQLCLEGYYNDTTFHRLIKGFIVQGGDPNGDGTGGESIYGEPFKDEFHSRLRFVRRGLVAMANSGKDDNTSQFFFTLGATPELQNKNTIFGKVAGNTLYNMLKLEDGLVDHDDKPLYPHKITATKVLANPFTDIVPRVLKEENEVEIKKPIKKVEKNFTLLSFGEEAEEDEMEINAVSEAYKGQSKSSHDLTDDPKLSSVPAIAVEDTKTSNPEVIKSIKKKLMKNIEKDQPKEDNTSKDEETNDEELNRRKEVQRQIKELKKELSKKKRVIEEVQNEEASKEEEPETNEVLARYHQQLNKYGEKAKKIFCKGSSEREKETLKALEKFQSKLKNAHDSHPENVKETSSGDDDEDDNDRWLVHSMRAEEEKMVLAIDANMPSADRYDITDPRNPIAERRRQDNRRKERKKD